jgi:hypothetical protein
MNADRRGFIPISDLRSIRVYPRPIIQNLVNGFSAAGRDKPCPYKKILTAERGQAAREVVGDALGQLVAAYGDDPPVA